MLTSSALQNVLVIGGSYVGRKTAVELAKTLSSTHRVLLIEPYSHFQHLFAFPRFAVLPGHEHKAFIPYDRLFLSHGVPEEKGLIVRAAVQELKKNIAILDRFVDTVKEITFEYAIISTGTKLPPPGTMKTEEKLDGIAYFRLHQQRVAAARRIVILGGGAVGVQMATDIKELYPDKEVTVIHSREKLMPRFHPLIHDVITQRFSELGINVIVNDRAVIPAAGFPVEQGEFNVVLQSGQTVAANFAILSIGQVPQSQLMKTLSPASIKPTGFLAVRPTLQLADTELSHIFAVGDVADTGLQKAARPAIPHIMLVVENVNRLFASSACGDSAERLGTYSVDPPAIKMSLGLKKLMVFRDPRPGQPEPQVTFAESGAPDAGIARWWGEMGASTDDFHL